MIKQSSGKENEMLVVGILDTQQSILGQLLGKENKTSLSELLERSDSPEQAYFLSLGLNNWIRESYTTPTQGRPRLNIVSDEETADELYRDIKGDPELFYGIARQVAGEFDLNNFRDNLIQTSKPSGNLIAADTRSEETNLIEY